MTTESRSLTVSLFVGAVAATLLDVVAFVIFIVPGIVPEANGLIARMDGALAIAARLLVIFVIGLFTIVAETLKDPVLTFAVRVMCGIAIIVGLIGALTTLVDLG